MRKQSYVFFDRIIGPTYHFGGLSFGNLHSMTNESFISYPKKAALEGLNKMKLVSDYGFKQYVFPPQQREYIGLLRQLGFSGDDRLYWKMLIKKILFYSVLFSRHLQLGLQTHLPLHHLVMM